ncbi:hypothetical protein [Pseudoxanthomonas mexicana]
MPITPNYAFEKRQRELAKKNKLEEKKARKRESTASTLDSTPAEPAHSTVLAPVAATEDAKGGPRVHRKRSP